MIPNNPTVNQWFISVHPMGLTMLLEGEMWQSVLKPHKASSQDIRPLGWQWLHLTRGRKLWLTASQQQSTLPGLKQLTGFLRKRVIPLIPLTIIHPDVLEFSKESPKAGRWGLMLGS